jgi:hypothetical protein
VTAPTAAPASSADTINLLSRGAADATLPSAPLRASVGTEAYLVRLGPPNMLPSMRTPVWAQSETWHRTIRQLRPSGVSIQDDGADTVDLLTQLHSRPVLA